MHEYTPKIYWSFQIRRSLVFGRIGILFFASKCMLWVHTGIASQRQFQCVPTTYSFLIIEKIYIPISLIWITERINICNATQDPAIIEITDLQSLYYIDLVVYVRK